MEKQTLEPLVTLYFIRHGETEVNCHNCVQGGRINPPLNERGRKQAKCIGERFRHQHLDWIVTSTSLRALETGAVLCKHHRNVPSDSYSELNELGFGDLEGTHVTAGYNDLVAQWDDEHNIDLPAPGKCGESPATCAQRVMPCLQAIVKRAIAEDKKAVCMVVHSRLIQIVLAGILDGSLATMKTYKQKKAAVNIVDICSELDADVDADAGRWPFRCVAREINSVSHMPDDVVSHISSADSLKKQTKKDGLVRFEIDSDGKLVLKQL
ncbi:hypothetical protein GGI25_002827 [Coemansia spiralis]|uniref:Phosphoglycerate mutase-like protein n=2 Tax=Coemansia TaxID=4863 RepID=A0A9W8KY56_9FUNG|nr:histidine phosphatase superfamily [Coemansia spiralis]KAJ1989058.1 hypothetical protein EDC05_004922 [Coemansia umbellata]KAJ2622326.1 hypothetical protein GGI26_003337 [Coemansia sp. RSA 1358]KAJ2677875.1 hypothetical protein GGI25_002827 [Coemansia spiralis]